MIWKHFWPGHYEEGRILPWTSAEVHAEFDDFLGTHMRKVIALRRSDPSEERRYISKNNLNIARLADPPPSIRHGIFLVPFRDPIQQAASMWQQHQRFLAIHEAHDFIREYMEAIGHDEFGKGLRPVDFGAWLGSAPPPDRLEFWLRYWIATYQHILDETGSRVHLLSYSRLTEDPERSLGRLASVVGVSRSKLAPLASRLRPPRHHEIQDQDVPAEVEERAR